MNWGKFFAMFFGILILAIAFFMGLRFLFEIGGEELVRVVGTWTIVVLLALAVAVVMAN